MLAYTLLHILENFRLCAGTVLNNIPIHHIIMRSSTQNTSYIAYIGTILCGDANFPCIIMTLMFSSKYGALQFSGVLCMVFIRTLNWMALEGHTLEWHWKVLIHLDGCWLLESV